ncbi:MAG: class C sortase [Oscillospiraceae bacterium]|nr:class C sortase [Oscillospiraceae bacterium]
MKKILPILLVILMILLGVGLLFYPDISTWYNSRVHSGLMQTFDEEVAAMDDEYIAEHFRRAEAYNAALNGGSIEDPFVVGSGAVLPPAHYLETLNVNGMMAQIEIPIIDVHLPVFHGTGMAVLDRGVGHIEGTSFPIGGQGTHAVLTGHSGLTHHRMFTDLEEIVIGDLFFITVLDRKLAYEVDQIIVVLPHEIESLRIAQDADYVTLITCTPYAINTHRLLIRGARIPYEPGMIEEIVPVTRVIDWRLVIIIVMVLIFLFVFILFKRREKKKARERRAQKEQKERTGG